RTRRLQLPAKCDDATLIKEWEVVLNFHPPTAKAVQSEVAIVIVPSFNLVEAAGPWVPWVVAGIVFRETTAVLVVRLPVESRCGIGFEHFFSRWESLVRTVANVGIEDCSPSPELELLDWSKANSPRVFRGFQSVTRPIVSCRI